MLADGSRVEAIPAGQLKCVSHLPERAWFRSVVNAYASKALQLGARASQSVHRSDDARYASSQAQRNSWICSSTRGMLCKDQQ